MQNADYRARSANSPRDPPLRLAGTHGHELVVAGASEKAGVARHVLTAKDGHARGVTPQPSSKRCLLR